MKHKNLSLALIFISFIFIFSLTSLKVESKISNQDRMIIVNYTNSTETKIIVVQPAELYSKTTYDASKWAGDGTVINSSVAKFNAKVVREYSKYFYKIIDVQGKDYDNFTQDLRSKGYAVWDNIPRKIELDKSVPLMEGKVPFWSGNLTGNQIIVAIIDTGIDDSHLDFDGRFGQPGSRIINWIDTSPDASGTPIDRNGHGTAVASMVAGSGGASNGKYRGVAPGALLLIAKAGDRDGIFEDGDIADAVDWAVQQGAQIISMSLGGAAGIAQCTGATTSPPNTRRLFNSINNAIANGVFVVVAAGNAGPMPQTIDFPGCIDNVITVGAVMSEDTNKTISLGVDYWNSVSESAIINSRVYFNGVIENEFERTGTNLRDNGYFSGTGIQLLLSPTSVKNLYPISCFSESGNEVYGDKYSEDAIVNSELTANSCQITADDTNDDGEHNRRAGAICSGATTTVIWTDWQTSNQDVAKFIGNSCPAGTRAIACLTTSATSENENNYGDDNVMSVFISMSTGVCQIVANDIRGGFEQKRKVGTVCSNIKTEEVWSSFDMNNDNNPVFYSPSCPSGMHPISCLTMTAYPVSEGNYGEDDVVSITIEDNRCRVMATDTVGGDEHQRSVGAICTNDASAFSVQWNGYSLRNSSTHDGADSKVETFSGGTCPAGTNPISCLTETAIDSYDNDKYGEDDIEEMTFDSDSKCRVVADDNVGDAEQKRRVEILSSETQPTILWSNWEVRSNSNHDGSDSKVETFYSPLCPSGKHSISCLTETAEEENGGIYGEDDVIGVTMVDNACKVTAHDSVGDGEHKRKVGAVCSDIPITVDWTNWQTSNQDVAKFESNACSVGTNPIACLTYSANEEREDWYGEDAIITIQKKDNKCVVYADDNAGGFEQKRKVGVVCSSSPAYSFKTLNWLYQNNDYSTFYSIPSPQPLQILIQGQYKNGGDYGWNPGGKAKHDELWSFIQPITPDAKVNIEIGGLPSTTPFTHFDINDPNTFYFRSWIDDFGNKDRVVIYSSRGPPVQNLNLMKPNILAPGHLICAARAVRTDFGDQCDSFTGAYHKMGGTSAATPHVSGAIALLLDANPRATHDEILNALYEGAVKRNSYDPISGYDSFAEGVGRVDVKNSVNHNSISRCYDYTGTLTLSPKNLGSLTTVRAMMSVPNCTLRLGEIIRQSDDAVMCTATTYHGYAECNFDTGAFIGTQTFAFVVDGITIATDSVNRDPLLAPVITILSPVNNTSYYKTYVSLKFTIDKPTSWIGYSLNYTPSVTISGPINLTSLTNGWNNITVFANDSAGNMGSSNTNRFFYCLGDLTGTTSWVSDGKVDIRDVSFVAKLFGCNTGSACYDSRADLNGDGRIDIKDVSMVAKQFGKAC